MPKYTVWRKLLRAVLWILARGLVKIRTRLTVSGFENFPRRGPGLIVLNHLGDADIVVILSHLPTLSVDLLGASNLYYDYRWLGILGDLYGTIWLHRGRPDRRALTCALESLKRGRFVAIAPEGRESLNGGLEQGLGGAAFLALKAGVPVIPVVVTGTGNAQVADDYRHHRRTLVTMTVGKSFRLERSGTRHADLSAGTERIMYELAHLLPREYRGIYQNEPKSP